MGNQIGYPFAAIVGQEKMKKALLLNMINRKLGGVLIMGEKGTAKTTTVRAAAGLMTDMKVIHLPVSATEDRVVGTLDIQHAIQHGEKKFEPGLLAEADGHFLYVDEINLLEDHLIDVLLDAAASGMNTVEREGISYKHAARFVLVGTMNPEEGELRPQLLDRFAMSVEVTGEKELDKRIDVIRRRMEYEAGPEVFASHYEEEQIKLRDAIESARVLLPHVQLPGQLLELAAEIAIRTGVDGHRTDITMMKTAATLAAFRGAESATLEDLQEAAELVVPHRIKRRPFEDECSLTELLDSLFNGLRIGQ